jgi:AbrB family looped-hinge helix DNA binding protein
MPLLSQKRQITIPKDLCDRLQIRPGDEIDILEHDGRVTLIKKRKDASKGVLKHLRADRRYTDDDSLMDAVASRRSSTNKTKKHAA